MKPDNQGKFELIGEVLEIVLIVFALSWFLKTYVLAFTGVRGEGMLPTLGPGNQVLAVKLGKSETALSRGDILVFTDSSDNPAVRRLIGLPGDKVEIKNGLAYVNDHPLYEPYARTPLTYRFAAVVVPKNQLFVLNDNRSDLNDSRKTGSVALDKIQGRAVLCYWPWINMQFL